MRELIFKNLTTLTAHKRDVSVEEITERNGLVSSTKKRSMYFVRGTHPIKSKEELEQWVTKRKKDPDLSKKFFHILRDYSDKEKTDKLLCKMRGSFYVVSGAAVYDIVFVHAIKIAIRQAHGDGEQGRR